MNEAPDGAAALAAETPADPPRALPRAGHPPHDHSRHHRHHHAPRTLRGPSPAWPGSVLLRLSLAQRLLVAVAASLLVWLLIASVLS